MIPAEVRAVERHHHAVAFVLVVIGAEPVKAVVMRDVPRIAEATREDFQVLTPVIATQDAAHQAPVVLRVLVSVLVVGGFEGLRRRGLDRGGLTEQLTKWRRRDALGMRGIVEPLAVAFAHVELAVRCPHEAVQRVLDVAEVGEDLHVFIRDIIAVEVTHDGEIRRVRHPQIAAMPGEALDAVQAGGKDLLRIRHAIAVRVLDDAHTVARRVRRGIPILRSHADEQAPLRIERHGARLLHQRFFGKDGDAITSGHGGQRLQVRARVHHVGVGAAEAEDEEQEGSDESHGEAER